MKNQRISGVVIALAAGLVGGLVSRYVAPTVVLAQTQTAPKELRAHNFVLVNDQGNPVGLFGFDPQGKPIIKLIAENGRTIWSSEMALASGTFPPPAPPAPPLRIPTPQLTPQK